MSQWGAQAMALGGSDYEAILKHYYTGIALTNVGGP
jgi:SpoIID/LytB domain protein